MYGSMVAVKIVIFILLFREHALGLHLQPMTIVLNSSWQPVTLVFAPSEVKWLAHVYLLVNVPVLYKALP
jgi:hypothetical protein